MNGLVIKYIGNCFRHVLRIELVRPSLRRPHQCGKQKTHRLPYATTCRSVSDVHKLPRTKLSCFGYSPSTLHERPQGLSICVQPSSFGLLVEMAERMVVPDWYM